MKAAGFLLLVTGWMLVLSALVLLPGGGAGAGNAATGVARAGFLCAGLAVEVLGLVLVLRSHLMPRKERS
jgi:hypothetical protein